MLHALTVELASSGRIRIRSDDYFEMRKGGEIVVRIRGNVDANSHLIVPERA